LCSFGIGQISPQRLLTFHDTCHRRPATSRYRWIICALLFFATVIAYVDRGVLGYLEKYWKAFFISTASSTAT